MAQTFNGATLTFTAADSGFAGVTFKVRNVSESGNSRPDIDVTSSTDTERRVVPGLAEVSKLSFECVYDVDNMSRANLETLLKETEAGTLLFKLVDDGATPAADTMVSENAWLTGVTYSGELDGVMTATVEFTLDRVL